MNWTYGYDWEKEYQDKKSLTEIMLNSPYLSNGASLLMHDRKWTREAIEDIVKDFHKKLLWRRFSPPPSTTKTCSLPKIKSNPLNP
ncbi:hypothetical protein [Peribacillus butanolivorans]|uniref:hypothetical protein n=1 Tax=Peribacillus butanolivorans TaxID=421767 RepID=UPI00366D8788